MLSSNGPGAVQAARFLKEIIDLEEMERSNHRDTSPLDTLQAISKISPLLAMAIARRDGVGWDLPAVDLLKAQQELRTLAEVIQEATARANASPPPPNGSAAHLEENHQ